MNDGAAALASEPTARSTLATPSSARGEYRVSSRPATSAATTASGAARIRSCPAAAIETPKSSATSLRIGERTSTPAWLATNARKSTSEGDASAEPPRETACGAAIDAGRELMPDRVAVRRGRADTACPRKPGCGEPNAARGVLACREVAHRLVRPTVERRTADLLGRYQGSWSKRARLRISARPVGKASSSACTKSSGSRDIVGLRRALNVDEVKGDPASSRRRRVAQ